MAFREITLLITHYNRSNSLERLLKSLVNQELFFGEIIVADDGSNEQHLGHAKELANTYHFTLVESPVNQGLGHNLNMGQNAVKTPYTLYIQEDFVPTIGFKKVLEEALRLLLLDPGIDVVRFFANFGLPYTKPLTKDFSELLVPFWGGNYNKVFAYSDNPHLRRSNFLEKFGPYREGIPGDRTEYHMCISFIKHGGRAVLYNRFQSLFQHINTPGEESTMKRAQWKLKPNPFIDGLKYLYRQVRYNIDIRF